MIEYLEMLPFGVIAFGVVVWFVRDRTEDDEPDVAVMETRKGNAR